MRGHAGRARIPSDLTTQTGAMDSHTGRTGHWGGARHAAVRCPAQWEPAPSQDAQAAPEKHCSATPGSGVGEDPLAGIW